MDTPLHTTAHGLRLQSQVCEGMGSPFSARILALAADAVGAPGPVSDLFGPWEGASVRTQIDDAVALRFLGALHDLALSGDAPDLAAAYPSPGEPGDPDQAWRVGLDLMRRDPIRFTAFMGHEPQTNETRRSICLLGGFLAAARETGLPLRIFELGASAGLNQNWDRFHYRAGDASWGDPASPVKLDTEWRGAPAPFDAPAEVISRAACDRKPVDLADPDARRRLRAYIWADQPERLARLDAAIGLALETGVTVETADAADWIASRVSPADGAATVLFHSVFWSYLPRATAARIEAMAAELGERATSDAPFAWLRVEPPPPTGPLMDIRLTLWPTGEERLLGHCNPHGAWVEWL